jgi:hypothetical protein
MVVTSYRVLAPTHSLYALFSIYWYHEKSLNPSLLLKIFSSIYLEEKQNFRMDVPRKKFEMGICQTQSSHSIHYTMMFGVLSTAELQQLLNSVCWPKTSVTHPHVNDFTPTLLINYKIHERKLAKLSWLHVVHSCTQSVGVQWGHLLWCPRHYICTQVRSTFY